MSKTWGIGLEVALSSAINDASLIFKEAERMTGGGRRWLPVDLGSSHWRSVYTSESVIMRTPVASAATPSQVKRRPISALHLVSYSRDPVRHGGDHLVSGQSVNDEKTCPWLGEVHHGVLSGGGCMQSAWAVGNNPPLTPILPFLSMQIRIKLLMSYPVLVKKL